MLPLRLTPGATSSDLSNSYLPTSITFSKARVFIFTWRKNIRGSKGKWLAQNKENQGTTHQTWKKMEKNPEKLLEEKALKI